LYCMSSYNLMYEMIRWFTEIEVREYFMKVGRLILIVMVLVIVSCSYNNLADYDQRIADKIIEVYRMINLFYLNMAECDSMDRQYSKFSDDYKRIEVELKILVLMNEMRPMNKESVKQAENILDLWIKYKDAHEKNNTYSDVKIKLHRKRFNRNFAAMATGEQLKMDNEGY